MDLNQAIDARRSRRKYLEAPITKEKVTKLKILIEEYNQTGNIRMELILNNGEALRGLRKSYGMFSGVRNYIGLIEDKNDAGCAERLGYYGESLMLHAVAMELGTCWVGGTFDRKSCPFQLAEHEKITCIIVVGNVEQEDSRKERFLRRLTHRKTKAVEEMFRSDESVPDWFMNGMHAVQKAPSAVNRQPVMFSFKNGRVTANVKDSSDPLLGLDFGIAKLHFEIGAGSGKWDWGNQSKFTRSTI